MRRLLLIPVLTLFATPMLFAQGSTPKPGTLEWGPAPAGFPRGAQMALISGDPARPGAFRIQLKMPDGYRIPPHFHTSEENIQVKQGTFLVGMGDVFDASKTRAMKPGEEGTVPANGHHFAQAQGETIVSVAAIGPFAMTYINPPDDPRKSARP
ncbi:MAG: cupin domain-containing protein [Gemmatimonadota bacterium]